MEGDNSFSAGSGQSAKLVSFWASEKYKDWGLDGKAILKVHCLEYFKNFGLVIHSHFKGL
jgi:hypothetical protein